ncbi:MobF family relaxase [Streptomyces sp. TG1A-8]|nr:MobF family relaxase [Streptomyces sp. TG1A-8]MDO0929777.1 MobF family relaxase [Streptomyces sp. TG1A-8]
MEGAGPGRGRPQGRGCGDRAASGTAPGEGRHPDADRIERERLEAGDDPAKARRATVLGRPIEHNRSPKTDKAKERTPWLAMDLVFRAPSTAHIAWALGDDETRLVLELWQDIARDKTLAWFEASVAEIRWRSGGKIRKPVRDGLIVAVFRHYESRAAESKPLLHDHAVVSIRARRPDDKGTWGNLSADSLMAHIVAADTLYLLYFMEEVSDRWLLPEGTTHHKRPRPGDRYELAVQDTRSLSFDKSRGSGSRQDKPVTVVTVTFEGRLEVTDPDALRRALTQGIGRARAYGCGLLTLAPLAQPGRQAP